uniref:Ion transport peptide n=1 Tax=Cacopsylla melanoneura TaxID=428564 RepID=A0A8D8RWE2_9HEMI
MLQCRLTLLVSIIMTVTMLVLSPAVHSSPVNMRNNQIAGHPLSKRSFFDIQCKGVYDKSIFARLDRICEDCYDLFRAPQIHTLCRQKCFRSIYFKGCLDSLALGSETRKYQSLINYIGKRKDGGSSRSRNPPASTSTVIVTTTTTSKPRTRQ